jgi:hypothetical protein
MEEGEKSYLKVSLSGLSTQIKGVEQRFDIVITDQQRQINDNKNNISELFVKQDSDHEVIAKLLTKFAVLDAVKSLLEKNTATKIAIAAVVAAPIIGVVAAYIFSKLP